MQRSNKMRESKVVMPVAVFLVGIALLSGCQRDAGSVPAVADPSADAARAAFVAAEQRWRDERKAGLLAPDGWTSLVGLHWIDPGPHYVGSEADNGIKLAKGPPQLGMLDLGKNGGVRLVPDKAATLTLDDAPITAPTALKTDEDEAGPSRIGFDGGKGMATVIKRGERYALRVKHADADSRVHFTGLNYWPADPAWNVQARFLPHPAGKTIPIASIIGTIDDTPNPGAVEFVHGGKTYRLEAIDEGDGELFLVFADRSNGHGSYGAGRFLDAGKPDAAGGVQLDFNRSYNPPCAFTPFATCPLPPPENRLDLAITSGEKTYAHPKP